MTGPDGTDSADAAGRLPVVSYVVGMSLQQKPGHTTLTMTSKYVHLADQQLAGISNRISPMDTVSVSMLRRKNTKRPKG